ncbi:histidine phosphatase family protein [Brevundimonas sp.]|uniref:SixA phosphatase family protein n=1 Tax=Brevundimonas sp. TaxID=1871086 RepID=UPI0025E30A0C|nr:histidine phosphatase family protein [Brevundimonas sp.]
MRRLILMRHAEAEPSSATGDIGRRLTALGQADARAMGEALASRGFRPDLALVSSATRARQTWDGASAWFGDAELVVDPGLYNAAAETLRAAVEAVADRAGVVLLIAHNPGLHRLTVELAAESAEPAAFERVAGGLEPAAAAVFVIDAGGQASLEDFIQPGDLG